MAPGGDDAGPGKETLHGEQKEEAIKLVQVSGEPIRRIAIDLGIPQNTLQNWVRKAKIEAGEGAEGEPTSQRERSLGESAGKNAV